MEVNRAESAAVAAVGGVPADVLDTAGRLVVTPNALTLDGQRNVPADLQPGESLASFLDRHVPGIESGAWTVMIGGAVVPQPMWGHTFPKHGQLIACRAVLRKSALQLVAIAALSYFTMGAGAGWIAGSFGVSAGVAGAIGLGMFMAGSVLINKVLAPKIPSAQSLAQKQIYSLSDQRNTARPYEPIPVLWGEMRVTPDLASKSYAWYEGDDQYMSTILLGGINVQEAFDLAIGDTPIGNFSHVGLYFNGFPGMPSQNVPLYSNVDAVAGAEFVNGGDWITRTGSAGAGVLQLDIEGQLYDVGGKGNINANWVDLTIQARLVGAPAWTTLSSSTLTNASTDVLRRTFSFDVAPGQYEVRAKLGVPRWNDGGSGDACKFSWVSLKSVQADATDYSQWGRIGIKIRASGQLSGSLDQVRATYRAKPMPIWTGTGWATATTRADGLSNPGAILLQTLRGVWATDTQGQRVLQFGFGLSDEQIDIEGLKAFMLHCAARGYTYDKWVTTSMSLGAFCDEVALAGMGEFAWTDGSRPTAVFVTNGQPNSAVVNMANMLKGGFSVDYALSNAADGIEYQWLNRDTWETTTLRVMAPGVTTMLSPARVTGEGITSEAHAAVMARYHLAQSLYQYKTVHYTADIEHLDYRRLSVLSVSHDLTQWGFGGRVMAAKRIGAQVQVTLDEPVPALASAYIGLRVPGARDYRVWPVQPLAAESDVVTLVGEWPEDLDFPGEGIGNPAHDTLWCYDFKATPGYRVRVTGIDPESDLKGARVTAVPEGPEFWDYVLNGTYVPAPNQSSIPQLARPVVKNLRVSEKVNLQGDTEWYELSCVWDVEGDCDHAQVWAGRDGSELRMVDGNAQGARSTFRIDGAGEWLIEVLPFNANGQSGQAAAKLFITAMTGLPPRNPGTFVVQEVAGGLRRFSWMWSGDKPAALSGVQIRYLPGDVPVSVASWDAMQPLGEADDIYTAQFETTKPGAGTWTFGLRAIDTAGQLANGVMRFVAVLDKVFENIREPDLTPPPAPTGVTAVPLMTTAQVNWASPTYTVGHGHDHSVIYAALWVAGGTAPAFSAAKSVGTEQGHPASIPVELGSKYTIWVAHVSVDGVESAPSAGVTFVTAQDVGNLLGVLEGKITESQLYSDLGQRIDLIDGPDSLNGSVAARIKSEQTAREEGDMANAKAITTLRARAGNGGNQIDNSEFAVDLSGWTLESGVLGGAVKLGRNLAPEWTLPQGTAYIVEMSGHANPAAYCECRPSANLPVVAGKRYQFSIYTGAHRCAVAAFIYWLNGAGAVIGNTQLDVNDEAATGGQILAGYKRLASFGEAPAGAVGAICVLRKITTKAGYLSSYAFFTRALLCEANETQTEPDAYTPGGLVAALQAESSVRASQTGDLFAKYTVKVDVNGYVSGFGLASTANNAAPVSSFAVRADQFYVASPSGPGVEPVTPFAVQTTAQTVNGVTVPAGVYMDSAYINNVNALWGRFGTLVADTIQATDISVSKLTAGYMQVGSYIASTNYAPGASGFVSYASGNAEYNNITMRGTVYANSGVIGGININANGLNAGGFSGYAWPASGGGFHLGPNGLLLGNLNTGQYVQMTSSGGLYAPGLTINGGNATFGGNLSAASGTFYGSGSFSGTLSASTLTTVGGRFTAYSDGSVVADRVDIRRREAMATGSVYWGASSTTSDPISLWGPDGALIYIDTGIDFAAATDFSVNQPLHAVAEVYSSVSQGGVSNGTRLFEVMCSATPFISASHYPGVFDWPYTHATSQLSPRIYIAVRARIVNQQPSLWQVTLGSVRWSLFKS